jgi:tRNA (cytidine/uridine-2'-O-)-methyltransferase
MPGRLPHEKLTVLHIALLEPEIPPNTGNIARLCAATGSALHLIGRLGFRLDNRALRRAGLDYWHAVDMRRHDSYDAFESTWADAGGAPLRVFAFSARAKSIYTRVSYQDSDCLLFGGETHGLPAEMIARFGRRALTIPMPAGAVRSLNLASAAGIVLYEALRQLHGW